MAAWSFQYAARKQKRLAVPDFWGMWSLAHPAGAADQSRGVLN